MKSDKPVPKSLNSPLLFVTCTLAIQILIILSLRSQLGHKLPTYFQFTGNVTNWFDYQRPVILPGILFLAVFHIAGILFYKYLPQLLSHIPILIKYLPSANFLTKFAFSWIECLTWPVLLYYFIYNSWTTYLMLAINSIYLLVLVFKIIMKNKDLKAQLP